MKKGFTLTELLCVIVIIGFDKNGNQIDQSIDGVSKEFGDNVKDVFLMVGYTGDSKGDWTVDGCITLEELQYMRETLL